MSRTPAQIAADQALTAAIEVADRAYGGSQGDVLGDYIVLAAWSRLGDDGEIDGLTSTLTRDNAVATYRVYGLHAAAARSWQARSVAAALHEAGDQ